MFVKHWYQTNILLYVALGGTRAEDEYNEANKRHTMSHPPEHIPDINNQSPAKAKSPKEKKEKEKKEKVILLAITFCVVNNEYHSNDTNFGNSLPGKAVLEPLQQALPVQRKANMRHQKIRRCYNSYFLF